ncbi:RcnB family protein [Hephaestia sp. GCM10023244]|uniref:RcnB family protein n=1 Tax=unclassified Hephaestia TaxID=2631281 RepID=UPI002077265C|nr:RcnB family protein [Hephaestia sp. MAHUQ-44]MCM8731757.1 RcnB family protein [Hephaestia sp. MAHUQ-44]
MRGFLIAMAASAAMLATPALAQHHGHRGVGHWQGSGQIHGPQTHGEWRGERGGSWHWNGAGQRWGGAIEDRWYGGAGAPGGWTAYRQPVRGDVLPPYWLSPSWTVWDWADYGLPRPPRGYVWSRYYDDAVLIDRAGQVRDHRGDMDWGDDDRGYDDPAYDDGYHAAPRVAVQPDDARYPAQVVTRCVGDCGGVFANGYYYPPQTETTVTIPARPPVVRTITTAPAGPARR